MGSGEAANTGAFWSTSLRNSEPSFSQAALKAVPGIVAGIRPHSSLPD
jgi:hypothetical protein